MSTYRNEDWLAEILREVREDVFQWPTWKRSDEVQRDLRKLDVERVTQNREAAGSSRTKAAEMAVPPKDWKEIVFEVASTPVRCTSDNKFLVLVQEFTTALGSGPYMHTVLREDGEQGLHVLYVRPKCVRGADLVLLKFWITQHGVVVIGGVNVPLRDEEAIKRFFADFAKGSTLSMIVEQCADICTRKDGRRG